MNYSKINVIYVSGIILKVNMLQKYPQLTAYYSETPVNQTP